MEFYEAVETSLSNSDYNRFRSLFFSSANESSRDEMSWDLALLLMTHLGRETSDDEARSCLQEANLDLSCRSGNPKELFLVYLQNAGYFGRDERSLVHFFDLMEALFLRARNPKFVLNSLDQMISVYHRCVRGPSIAVRKRYTDFIDSLARQNRSNTEWSAHANKPDLDRFLTKMSINNLLDTVNNNNPQTDQFELVSNICSLISRLNSNTLQLVVDLMYDESTRTHLISLHEYSLSLYACLLVSPDQYPTIPCVYEKFYVFRTILGPINQLLAVSNKKSYLKSGLEGLTWVLGRQDPGSWPHDSLELVILPETVELLLKISVFCQEDGLRRLGGQLLRMFFSKFERRGRFDFLKNFLSRYLDDADRGDQSADYVCSYLIYLFKEEMNECFSKQDGFYFNNRNFTDMFNIIFNKSRLKRTSSSQRPESLIQNSTRVTAELNLLRFLLLRDKTTNYTQIYSIVKSGEFYYLEWVRDHCRISRMFHEDQLRDLKSGNNQASVHSSIEISVNNRELNEPSRNEKIEAASNTLRTIDMIDCLRIRVDEIISEVKN